jgi:hypothetical protein
MQPRREGMIWQVLGLLVVIAATLEIRSAAQHFTATFGQSYAGAMDIVWPLAMEVFAGFLLLAGAAAMISGHVLRVLSGVTHRARIWSLAGWFCCLASIAVVVEKMTLVAMSREGHYALSLMKQDQDFMQMLTSGGFAIWISGGYVFLLGVMLLMADRLGRHLSPANAAGAQPSPRDQGSAHTVRKVS